jgi:hypothetical protein
MNKIIKHLLRNIAFLVITTLLSVNIFAQEVLLNPTSTVYQLNSDIPEYTCPNFNVQKLIAEDKLNDSLGISPVRFAKGFDLNISTNNSGSWESIDDSIHVWRYKITSQEAFSYPPDQPRIVSVALIY